MKLARFAIGLSAGLLVSSFTFAKPLRSDEPPAEVTLVSGAPLGVGKMTVEVRDLGPPDSALILADEEGRVLYPAFERTSLRVPVERDAGPSTITAWFLFRGKEPLKLQLRTQEGYNGDGAPRDDAEEHARLLAAWWQRYSASARAVALSDLYPPLVENYLVHTLARRLKLPASELPSPTIPWNDQHDLFSTLSGAESIRLAAQSRTLLATKSESAADRPLPRPVEQPPVPLPKIDAPPKIEPIAQHVPVECFYVRCGSFANFVWLRDSLDHWGTQLRDLTSVRGVDYQVQERIGRQLALRDTALGRLLGDTVISDVAIIGNDTFLREGASLGVVFEARNSKALAQQIAAQRQQALRDDKQVRETKLTLAGREVSLLSTADNRVRSFYAVDGNYHFVATSQTLVRRFLEAGQGNQPLGDAAEFQWARTKLPLAAEQTAFVYLSDPFFRAMVSPQYRIEMTRRTRAAADLDLARVALLSAAGEGRSSTSVEELLADGYLPPGFGRRADGSQTVIADGAVRDSLRGTQGAFLPVPDVEITKATLGEVNAYESFARVYARQWQRMDPVAIGVRKQSLEGKKERVALDGYITPYAREHYQWLQGALGAEDKESWPRAPGDVATATINVGAHKYALGARDFAPSLAIVDGRVRYHVPAEVDWPLYAVGRPGEKQSGYALDVKTSGKPDREGITAGTLGLLGQVWLRQTGGLDFVAKNRAALVELGTDAAFRPADRPAKLRVAIGDFAETRIAVAMRAENYIRARKISAGNVLLFNVLAQQLHVPLDTAPTVAEQLLDGRPVCPLGGKFELQQGFSEFGHWQSDAWQSPSLYTETQVPASYQPPLLNWFAGLLLEFNIDATTLSTHLEIDVRSK